MLRRSWTSLLAVLALLAGGSALRAAPALASHSQPTYFEARELLNPHVRDRALAQLQSLGVHALRIELFWHDVAPAPNSRRVPAVDLTNPHSYHWGNYDPLIADANRLGWPVLLTLTGPAPRWATARARDFVTRPDPLQFERFTTAVARQYPTQISLFSIWNEPNHPQFLDPQYVHGRPASPRLYRALFQFGYQGLVNGGIKHPKVLIGETAPTGTGRDVAPLVFLRGALCLNNAYRMASSCSRLPAYGYAHHAYTKPVGPRYVPPNRDDVTIGVLSRLSRALDRAARAGALPAHLPIYLTEFGTQSKPNPFLGVPLRQQAEFDAIAEHIAWSNPRVAAFSQYLLRDDKAIERPGSAVRGLGPVGFQTGLELANGRAKPSYAGFRLPLTVSRRGGRYSLWGFVRPSGGATTVTVLVLPRGSRHWRTLRSVSTDSLGYWSLSSGVRGAAWQVRWRSPGGLVFSGPPIRAY